MAWIEPLELKTWFVNVLSGNTLIFTAIALLVMVGLAAYFRMSAYVMFFMMALFFLMFSDTTSQAILIILTLIGGLLIAYIVGKIVKN